MTAQIDDTLMWKGSSYSINAYALEGTEELFTPGYYNLSPVMMHTGCYRGYYCKFKLVRNQLLLAELVVNQEAGNYPLINGVRPEFGTGFDEFSCAAKYNKLMLPLKLTGTVRLAKGFIQSRYEHMGFQETASYRTIKQITLKDGILVDHVDLSANVNEIRTAQLAVEDFRKKYWLNCEWEDRLKRPDLPGDNHLIEIENCDLAFVVLRPGKSFQRSAAVLDHQ
jgi:hypothetical protein